MVKKRKKPAKTHLSGGALSKNVALSNQPACPEQGFGKE
jgi:hypothetical protein